MRKEHNELHDKRCLLHSGMSLQAELLFWGVTDLCGYPKQRMDSVTFRARVRFVALCIITSPWIYAPHTDMGQCIGDGTDVIVGSTDLTILHSRRVLSMIAVLFQCHPIFLLTSITRTNHEIVSNNRLTLLQSRGRCWCLVGLSQRQTLTSV